VTFEGTPPPPVIAIEGGNTQQVLYLDKGGGLQYAAVFLADARAGGAAPAAPAVLNQRSYIFVPQVLVVRAGQVMRFTSDDPAHHNVRSVDPNPANAFSVDTDGGVLNAPSHRFAATPPDRPVVLSCDIHPWMVAWVYAFEHNLSAVTDAAGRFRIENVPPGRHRLAVRQPAGGLARDLVVDVAAGQTTRRDVRFTANDVRVPVR